MPHSAKQHTLWADGTAELVPPGARAAEALARRSNVLDVLICFSRISRSSKCVETMEPWECVATKIASAV
jgi:hypothetical protein